jgi:RNA polymerase sigma factor (TIGR02999 family)
MSSPPDRSPESTDDHLTEILEELRQGKSEAQAELIPLIYNELRRLARSQMAWERPNHTLQTTALVHEAYLKLFGTKGSPWRDRAHFFSVAAEIMRQILVDHARKRRAQKRGGEAKRVELTDYLAISDENLERILTVHEILDRLKAQDSRQAQVVVLRFFGGLDYGQVAEVLGVSAKTVKRDWKHAQTWLYGELAT